MLNSPPVNAITLVVKYDHVTKGEDGSYHSGGIPGCFLLSGLLLRERHRTHAAVW